MQTSPFAPTQRMLRQFGGLWIVFFSGVAAWQGLHYQRHTLAIVLAILALTVGPLGIAAPRLIRPVFVGWMAVVYPIGWTVSRVVLGVLFYGLFTPVALVFRVIGRDELKLKPHPEAQSYWSPKAKATDKAHYLRQF